MDFQLIIGNEYVDLDPKATLAVTIQKVEIGDLSKSLISRTNQFKALKTEKNNRLFGFAQDEKSLTTIPYNYLDCILQTTQGTLILQGKCIIKKADRFYNLVVYEDLVSLVDALGDKNLSSLTWENQKWDNFEIDTARTNTSAFVAAVMNWGQTGAVYTIDRFLPMYYYKSLIEKILQFAGYALSGSILTNTDFTNLVCTPFYGFKYKQGYNKLTKPTAAINVFGLTASTDIYMSMPPDKVPNGLIANLSMTVAFTITWASKNPASTSGVRFFLDGELVGTFITTPYYIAGGTITFTASNVDTITEQRLRILVQYTKDPGFPDVVNIQTNDFFTSINVVDTLAVKRTNAQWARLASDVKLIDILKDFSIRFGIVYKKDGNTLFLKTLEEIANDTGTALDWTAKRVITKKEDEIDFEPKNYAQQNYFLFADNISDKFAGFGNLAISNTTLKTTQDFYTSPFSNARRFISLGYDVMQWNAYLNAATDISDIQDDVPLLLGTLKARTNETAITFNVTSRTDYKLAYFTDAAQAKDTSFQYFINKYYPTLASALQRNKVVTQYYILSDMDVSNYDPHKLIFDNGSYYIVNKIKNFVSGKVTEVELFKVN